METERTLDQESQEEIQLADTKFLAMPAKFGSIPVPKLPIGASAGPDPFEKLYPHIRLPIQEVETYSFGSENAPFNKLFWGDNLHIMRQLPKESIDLIYIDPPFFSGRNYNVIFGDNNEVRSFTDIWDGGIDGYLVWLNARLVQMKRLLKPTGSIYVHLDQHAAHYVKVEMDKIFGYENFRSEIVWCRYGGFKRSSAKKFPQKNDYILYYTKTDDYFFQPQYRSHKPEYIKRFKPDESGRLCRTDVNPTKGGTRKIYLDEVEGDLIDSVWSDISPVNPMAKERIGYPTQKPEALLERIINASSKPGDVIADFFIGGGTTLIASQKLNRKWIGCDQSRVAISVSIDRLLGVDTDTKGTRQFKLSEVPGFKVHHWGNHFVTQLSKLEDSEFRKFIVECFNGEYVPTGKAIHGFHKGDRYPIFVGSKNIRQLISKSDVISFAKATLENTHKNEGFMLGWGFDNEAKAVAHELRKREGIRLDFVKLEMIKIGTDEFRGWVIDRNKDYDNFLQFIQPPLVKVNFNAMSQTEYEFDASESQSMNSGEKIVNVQWDFSYDEKRFKSTPGFSYNREQEGAKLTAKFKFPFSPIGRKIACRVQDSAGGESFEVITLK